MAPTYLLAIWLCGSTVWVESSTKGQWPLPTFLSGRKLSPSSTLMPDTLVPPCMPLVPCKLLPQIWSSEEVSLNKSVCGFFKRDCLGLQNFLSLPQSLLVFAARSTGAYLPGTGTLGWRAWCGAGTPHSQDIPPEFLSTMYGCGTSPSCISTPPTSLDKYGFFNSVVVRLPFNQISDSSE